MSAAAERRLGTADVVVLGLSAALGAGVFAVWGPAAAAAGAWLPLSVLVAVGVTAATAAATADLVRAAPGIRDGGEHGGEFAAGRPELPPAIARLGGVAFLAGRCVAAAAAAHVFGSYVLPSAPLPTAVAAIVAATVLAIVGVRWTARASYALVGGIAAVLVAVVVLGMVGPGDASLASAAAPPPEQVPVPGGGVLGVLCGAGVVCFACAGLARVAVLGVAGWDPVAARRRGFLIALGTVLVGYLLLAIALLVAMGTERLGAEPAPLVAVVDAGRAPALGVLVRVGAAVAAGTALLAILAGLGATATEMAAAGELPRGLVPGRRPWPALLLGGFAAVVVAAVAGQTAAIVIASCCLLVGYAVVNLAAVRLPVVGRTAPRWAAVAGLVACLVLAAVLPPADVLAAVTTIAVGWVCCAVTARRRLPG